MMDLKRFFSGVRNYIGHGAKNGFFHIFAGNTLVKIISALSALLLPIAISKTQYGTFTLPDNYVQYVLLFNGLGIASAVLRYCTVFDKPEEKKAYFLFSIKFGVIFDLFLIAIGGVILYFLNLSGAYPVSRIEMQLLVGLALTPIFAFVLDETMNFLRATRENKRYSKLSVTFTAFYAMLPLALAFLFKLNGIIPGRYLAYIITGILCVVMVRSVPAFKEKAVELKRSEKVGMIKYSVHNMLASSFSLIMPLVETSIVCKFVASDAQRGDFRVASLMPQSVQYLTMSVIVFVFPYFAKHYRDGAWIYKNVKKLYYSLGAAMAVIIPLFFFLTPWLLRTFYHEYYNPETVHVMRVFWVTFGINAAIRQPTGNLLAAIGEVRFNLINAVVSFVLQTALCWVLVANYQLYGAAYGLLAAYVLSSLVGFLYLRYYCKKLIRKRAAEDSKPVIEDAS